MRCNKDIEIEKNKVAFSYEGAKIAYHIKNDAYIQGELGQLGVNLIDILVCGNSRHVNRVLECAFAGIVEGLYPMTKCDITTLTKSEDGNEYMISEELQDEGIIDDKKYVIELCVANMSATTLRYLYRLILEYIIYVVIADYLTLVNAEAAAIWAQKAEECRQEIKSAINRSNIPMRVKPHWI